MFSTNIAYFIVSMFFQKFFSQALLMLFFHRLVESFGKKS